MLRTKYAMSLGWEERKHSYSWPTGTLLVLYIVLWLSLAHDVIGASTLITNSSRPVIVMFNFINSLFSLIRDKECKWHHSYVQCINPVFGEGGEINSHKPN